MNSRKFLWGADLSGEAEYFIILGAQPVHSFGLILGHVENPFALNIIISRCARNESGGLAGKLFPDLLGSRRQEKSNEKGPRIGMSGILEHPGMVGWGGDRLNIFSKNNRGSGLFCAVNKTIRKRGNRDLTQLKAAVYDAELPYARLLFSQVFNEPGCFFFTPFRRQPGLVMRCNRDPQLPALPLGIQQILPALGCVLCR